jgi:hypothetical protein
MPSPWALAARWSLPFTLWLVGLESVLVGLAVVRFDELKPRDPETFRLPTAADMLGFELLLGVLTLGVVGAAALYFWKVPQTSRGGWRALLFAVLLDGMILLGVAASLVSGIRING